MNIDCLFKIEEYTVKKIFDNFENFKKSKEIRCLNLTLKHLYRLYYLIEEKIDLFKSDNCLIKSFLSLYDIFLYSKKNLFDVYNHFEVFNENQELESFKSCIHFEESEKIYAPLNIKFQELDLKNFLNKAVSPFVFINKKGTHEL